MLSKSVLCVAVGATPEGPPTEGPWATTEGVWATTEGPPTTEEPWATTEGPRTTGPWATTEGPWATTSRCQEMMTWCNDDTCDYHFCETCSAHACHTLHEGVIGRMVYEHPGGHYA